MAGLKGIWSFLFLCLLSQCAPSLQACTRPNPGANVILTPDQTSYSEWTYIIFSCPTGYTASSGNTYSYCYPGSPDYWSPAMNTVITCTRDTSVTTPATGNITAESMIFVADYSLGEIYMADFSSDSLDSLTFSPLPLGSVLQPLAVDYDPVTRMVYWTESSGSIRRGNIDGTGQSVIASGLGQPEGIALDTSRGKVFWTDEDQDRIVSADLDGSSQQVLIDNDVYRPRAIIVHPEEGVMFWTDWNYPSTIERANLDGGDRYVIVNSSLQWPNGLSFSADGSRIYWCDAGTDMIESVDFWGDNRMVHLATSSIHPYDLAVVDGNILWTDWDYDAIGVTLNNQSSSYSFYYHSVFQNPYGMHVYQGLLEEVPTPTEVYYDPTEQPTNEPTQQLSTENYWTPRPTWWWWYTTDQPRTQDNRTPRPTWWWWHTTDQPITNDNRTPRPTWWWWYTTDQPRTEDNRTPRPTWWWWHTTNQPIRTPRPTWWWWHTTDEPATDAPATTLSWYNPTTWWWGSTSYPPVDEYVNLVVGVTRTISSPNYPSNYHNYALYNWYITAPSGYGVLIRFLDFSLESSYDYLRIGTGDSRTSPGSVQRALLTGSNTPSNIRLDTPTSWMQFTSDGSITYRGFQLQLSLINSTSDPWTPQPTWWWNTDAPTTESSTTGWWWGTTGYPGDDQFDCDFDSGLCGWRQDVTDSFNWSLLSGSTGSSNTGPSSDHTTGYGKYIYTETSSPRVQGDVARLTSPEVVVGGMKCLQFYYHMYGATIGTLNVYVSKVGDPLGIPRFQIVGQQGNSWNLAQVDIIRAGTDRFVVTLEGICGSSFTGDIAIDDIIMFSGSCSQGQVRLVNGNEPNEGRVEVLYDGVWGTVCDDSWDINDGRVVCRSLGYRDVISAPRGAHFGQGSGPIWMDDVHCSGDEAHIFFCPHNGFGSHNCGHSEDASVICASPERELICDSTSMTLLLDRDLLEIGDDARDVHFEDESCVGYDHDSQRVAITTMYDRCDTKQEQEEDNMVFSNVVTYYKPRPENGTSGIITREHYLHIPVTCYLKRERILGESFTPGVDKYTYDEEGYGEFSLSLDRYTNAGFYQHANDSGMVELGTPLYFGVTLNSVTNLTLLIESCWATSSPYPLDDHRYDIIEDGCAVDSTTYIYYTSSPTFERFRVDAFTFIGDYDKVYVHCSILICDYRDTGSRCAQGCLSRARRSLQSTGSRSKPHTLTNGPLSDVSHFKHTMMVDNDSDGGETYDPLMIAALSALCVLIALTVIMSLVVVRLRRRRHDPEKIGYRRVGVAEDY